MGSLTYVEGATSVNVYFTAEEAEELARADPMWHHITPHYDGASEKLEFTLDPFEGRKLSPISGSDGWSLRFPRSVMPDLPPMRRVPFELVYLGGKKFSAAIDPSESLPMVAKTKHKTKKAKSKADKPKMPMIVSDAPRGRLPRNTQTVGMTNVNITIEGETFGVNIPIAERLTLLRLYGNS